MKHISVYVVLLQRTLLLDAAGPLEVLRVANREQQDIRFEVHYIGPEAVSPHRNRYLILMRRFVGHL